MRLKTTLVAGLCASALLCAGHAPAATVTHSSIPDFQKGIGTGAAQALGQLASPTSGAAGVVLPHGAPIVNDDFNYPTGTTAEQLAAAGWQFLLPNQPDPLPANISSFSFPGNGALRLHVWKQQDLWGTHVGGQNQPVLVMNNTPISGDFVAETKFTVQTPRANDLRLQGGIIVTLPSYIEGDGKSGGVTIDAASQYFVAAVQQEGELITFTRVYDQNNFPVSLNSGGRPSQTVWIRVVRSGMYFYTYYKLSDNGPWIEHECRTIEPLKSDPDQPVVIGIVEKTWNGATDWQDTDYDYFKISQLGTPRSGTFTNVMDAGLRADWQALSYVTQSMPGLKVQARAGNTLANGTLTDAGSFVGPDGTAATYFAGDVADILPSTFRGKRYLEYKLDLNADQPSIPGRTGNNLPAVVKNVSATYQPSPLSANFATNKTDWGADTAAVAVQPGDGDLGLKRTVVYRDDFDNASEDIGAYPNPGGSGWMFDPGDTILHGAVGDYSLSNRSGWLEMITGFPQDIFVGDNDFGGVKFFRSVNGLTDFEVETEINLETQQGRMSGLYLWQDKDNFMGIVATRRDQYALEIGILDDGVINNGLYSPDVMYRDYGSNNLVLRITKKGQIFTLAFRDVNSPTWRIHRVTDAAGYGAGGAGFNPTMAGLMTKSYGSAARNTQSTFYNYFQLSSVADTGTKDVTISVPASTKLDTLVPLAEGGGLSYQVKDSNGNFIGPDGTAGSTFTPDQPKLPAAVNGETDITVRATLSNASASGTPYLHALGVQYGKIVRDTNAADFVAGVSKVGVNTTTRPGAVVQEAGFGQPTVVNFTTPPTDWLFSNTHRDKTTGDPVDGPSDYSFTESPGHARLDMGRPEDLWALQDTAIQKPRVFLYKNQTYSGDMDIETHVTLPQGTEADRHFGIALVQKRDGAAPNENLAMGNLNMFGLYTNDAGDPGLRIMNAISDSAFGDNFGQVPVNPGTDFYLRLRRLGNLMTGYYRANPADPWKEIVSRNNATLTNFYVGFLAKSWNANVPPTILPVDFEYLKITPLVTVSSFESRVLDLGESGLMPILLQNGNTPELQIQVRAADTTAGLSSAAYVGLDGTAGSTIRGDYNGPLSSFLGKRYFQYKVVFPANSLLNDIAILGVDASTLPLSRADVQNALKIAGGIQSAGDADKTRLDVNGDGKVDAVDAVSILRTLNGL